MHRVLDEICNTNRIARTYATNKFQHRRTRLWTMWNDITQQVSFLGWGLVVSHNLFRCSYMAHTRIHTETGNQVCPDCGENFGDRMADFNKHIKLHCFHTSRITGYRCPVSDSSRSALSVNDSYVLFLNPIFSWVARYLLVLTIWLATFTTTFLFVFSNAPNVPSLSVHKIKLWFIPR